MNVSDVLRLRDSFHLALVQIYELYVYNLFYFIFIWKCPVTKIIQVSNEFDILPSRENNSWIGGTSPAQAVHPLPQGFWATVRFIEH